MLRDRVAKSLGFARNGGGRTFHSQNCAESNKMMSSSVADITVVTRND